MSESDAIWGALMRIEAKLDALLAAGESESAGFLPDAPLTADANVRAIAVRAKCDPKTVRRYLDGGRVRALSEARISSAILGLSGGANG